MKQSKYIPGDWVKASGHLCKVEEVFVNRFTKEYEYTLVYPNGNSSRIVIGEIEPVPISYEILEKNGWKKFKRPYSIDYCFKRKGYPTLNIYSKKEVSFHWGDHDESITTIHQLQRLLSGLGIDSEIKI